MTSDHATAENLESAKHSGETSETRAQPEVDAEQVIAYLRQYPDFFLQQDDLLAEISLPHESGKAISLLERQVTILRNRGIETRQKLGSLLENARSNDQLFDTTRNLILALLRARDVTEIVAVAQDQLSAQENVDACEIVLVANNNYNSLTTVRVETLSKLTDEFKDVFRLKRTYCGALETSKIEYLFSCNSEVIQSTAICPIVENGEVLGLLALGNRSDNYFNLNLDTLFLNFIGEVVGTVLTPKQC